MGLDVGWQDSQRFTAKEPKSLVTSEVQLDSKDVVSSRVSSDVGLEVVGQCQLNNKLQRQL